MSSKANITPAPSTRLSNKLQHIKKKEEGLRNEILPLFMLLHVLANNNVIQSTFLEYRASTQVITQYQVRTATDIH